MSGLGLVTILVLGAGYLVFGSLSMHPFRSNYSITVDLGQSGGLLPNQDVSYRGVKIGTVRSVGLSRTGVVARAEIDSTVRIPTDVRVAVSSLSPAGEQYLDFQPTSTAAPYLGDGAHIAVGRTTTPIPIAQVLGDMSGTLAQVDPDKLKTIVDQLGAGPQGAKKLATIFDGGAFLLSTLDSILPQSVTMLRNSKTVLAMLGDESAGLQATSKDLAGISAGVQKMDGGFRTFVDQGPGTLRSADQIVGDNSTTMVQLIASMGTVAHVSSQRVPAMQEFFFPQQRAGSTLDAIGTVFHDHAIWGLVDVYPRYACDYGKPRLPPSQPTYPEPYLNTFCSNNDPSVLVRGARNAPRPAGDDTADPPPGSDPLRTATMTPTGKYTIPQPFGGPVLVPPLPRP